MKNFVCGILLGIYIGTYYDCKPLIAQLYDFATKNQPKSN